MRKIACAVVGYGDRGSRYIDYALQCPEEAVMVAVVDPNPVRRDLAKKNHDLSDSQIFENLDDFLAAGIECDVVINATMDEMHYETGKAILEKGYNLMLEKPVTSNPDELLELERLANSKNLKMVVCHVLRYTPFYSKVKEVIDSGKIGKVVDMQLNEHIWFGHAINAYVRGKWRNEQSCGSSFLLAKCCHDTDLMCWLNNATYPTKVASFGSRKFYAPENAPEGATQYCHDCPHQATCPFEAKRFEIDFDFCPQYTWAGIRKPREEITREEKEEFLKHDVFGQCIYQTDMTIVDRQATTVEFANGSVGTLNLVATGSKAGRHIHVIGEYGEILGYIEDNKLLIRLFDTNKMWYDEELIDFGEMVASDTDQSVAGHYGGDHYIMKDLVRFLNGEKTSGATTVISDSINSHLVCYAADKSRREGIVVDIQKTYPRG